MPKRLFSWIEDALKQEIELKVSSVSHVIKSPVFARLFSVRTEETKGLGCGETVRHAILLAEQSYLLQRFDIDSGSVDVNMGEPLDGLVERCEIYGLYIPEKKVFRIMVESFSVESDSFEGTYRRMNDMLGKS